MHLMQHDALRNSFLMQNEEEHMKIHHQLRFEHLCPPSKSAHEKEFQSGGANLENPTPRISQFAPNIHNIRRYPLFPFLLLHLS